MGRVWENFSDVWARRSHRDKKSERARVAVALAFVFVLGVVVFVAPGFVGQAAAEENATAADTATSMITLIAQIIPWIFVLGIFGYLMRMLGKTMGQNK